MGVWQIGGFGEWRLGNEVLYVWYTALNLNGKSFTKARAAEGY